MKYIKNKKTKRTKNIKMHMVISSNFFWQISGFPMKKS